MRNREMKSIHVLTTGFHKTWNFFLYRSNTYTLKNGDFFICSCFILHFFVQEAMSRFAHVLVREKLT